jgi:hypothetical protein
MAFKRVLAGADRVPDLDALVIAAGRNKSPVGRQGHRGDNLPAKPEKKIVLTLLALLVQRLSPMTRPTVT